MLASLLLLHSLSAAVAADPPVRVWFNSDGHYEFGDRAKVYAQTADDGYLVVLDRKSTRLNSSHGYISYAVFCLKKKNKNATDFASGESEKKPDVKDMLLHLNTFEVESSQRA